MFSKYFQIVKKNSFKLNKRFLGDTLTYLNMTFDCLLLINIS